MGILDVLKLFFSKEKEPLIEEEFKPIRRISLNNTSDKPINEMLVKPVNIKTEKIIKQSNSYVSIEDNYYTFKNIDSKKIKDIKRDIKECVGKSQDLSTFLLNLYSCGVVFDYEYRHIIYDFISTYNDAELSPKESLAVGLALSQKWAENSLEAAEKIECYMENKEYADEKFVESIVGPSANDYYLTISLYKLFEKGKDIDRAIKWAEKIKNNNLSFIMDVARLYSKKDIQKAVLYMESIKEYQPNIYSDVEFQKQFSDYKKKLEKNYKYRPRKQKAETDQEKEMKINLRNISLQLREYTKQISKY